MKLINSYRGILHDFKTYIHLYDVPRAFLAILRFTFSETGKIRPKTAKNCRKSPKFGGPYYTSWEKIHLFSGNVMKLNKLILSSLSYQ